MRRVRKKVRYDPATIPKLGQEFSFEHFQEHLLLLFFLQPRFEALGLVCEASNPFYLLESLRIFSLFCQHGLHYRGRARDLHEDHTRQLYNVMMADVHQRCKPFWTDSLLVYDQLMAIDVMSPPNGAFYSAHRDRWLEVSEQDRLAQMGYLPQPMVPALPYQHRSHPQGSSTYAPGLSGAAAGPSR